MISDSIPIPDLAALRGKGRGSCTSAIPRPKSGTSRRASPINPGVGDRSSLPPSAKLIKSHLHRKSWHLNSASPPTSFRGSRPSQTSSDSLLPYRQREHDDLSGVQQQFYIQTLSTHSLGGPDTNRGLRRLKQASSSVGLQKSSTMGSLGSAAIDTIPPRRLLQPIGPPLPRTQTLANISCFGPPSQTPSPRKPTSVGLPRRLQQHKNQSQLDVADALGESRMTQKEMEVLLQVQREAAVNRARFRHTYDGKHAALSPKTLASGHAFHDSIQHSPDSEPAPSRSPSADNVASSHRQQGMRISSLARKPLFIDPGLANAYARETDPGTGATLNTIGSFTGSSPSDVSQNNSSVLRTGTQLSPLLGEQRNSSTGQDSPEENPTYWSGRYVSLCDRHRKEELKTATHPSSEKPNENLDRIFDHNERIRTRKVLKELRKQCKTAEALRGFEEFEMQLLKLLGLSGSSLQKAERFDRGDKPVAKHLKDSGLAALKPAALDMWQSAGGDSQFTSRVSSVNAEAVMTSPPSAFYGEGYIAKSKTTGNLAALVPAISMRHPGHIAAEGSLCKSTGQGTVPHTRRASYFECSPDTRAKAMKEREERAARRAAETHRRTAHHVPSLKPTKTVAELQPQPSSSKVMVVPASTRSNATSFKIKAHGKVEADLVAAMLESGHGLPPPLPVSKSPSPRVELVKVPGGGKEKVIKSRRKFERHISGEMVKSFLGVGMREVKKMGHRMSGMSWSGGSEEQLPTGRY